MQQIFSFIGRTIGAIPDPVAASMAAPSVLGDSQEDYGEAIPLPWPLTASSGTCSTEESLEEQMQQVVPIMIFSFIGRIIGAIPDPVAASMAAPSVLGDSQVEDGEAIPLPWPLTAPPGMCSTTGRDADSLHSGLSESGKSYFKVYK